MTEEVKIMRVFKGFTGILFIAILFAAVAADAQDISVLKSQQTVERSVFKRILALPYYGVFDNIRFTVDGGTVTLTGEVAEMRNRTDAESAVKRIDGVERVINNIEILPTSRFDDSIRRQTLRTFNRDGASLYRYLLEPRPSMRIIVKNGHLTLEGYVAGKGDSELAYILARTIPGVFSVTNNLVVGKEMYR